ncbi:MFS transporter [Streptomyces bluensis]|uniref:MFS transporter n=1 Tax=Streptomyces bluensis TaxID=33897 RepID=UPI00332C3870
MSDHSSSQDFSLSHARSTPDTSILAIAVTFLSGALTDRIGRRPLYIAACTAAILFAFPMYLLTNSAQPALVATVFILGIGLIHASLTGTQGSLLTEQFRTATRTSGASLGYQIAAAIGGFAPLLAAALVGAFGWRTSETRLLRGYPPSIPSFRNSWRSTGVSASA